MFGTLAALFVSYALIAIGALLAYNYKGDTKPRHWCGVVVWDVGWLSAIYCATERYSAHTAVPQPLGTTLGFMFFALVFFSWLGYYLAVEPELRAQRDRQFRETARATIVAARKKAAAKCANATDEEPYLAHSVFEQAARGDQHENKSVVRSIE
jgi:ABC-type dipeptide/oligopeptide/nickel transport system permease subunit